MPLNDLREFITLLEESGDLVRIDTPVSPHLEITEITDGLAPIGAWAAIRGTVFTSNDLPAWILLAVVTLWIGGFDLIYACQDVRFDFQVHFLTSTAILVSRSSFPF
jgi:hypothetical protein